MTKKLTDEQEDSRQYYLDNKEKMNERSKQYGLHYRLDKKEIIKAKAKKKYQLKKAQKAQNE